jgi:dTDP-4-amino-4,6-dideoxygalactose transaminase
MTDMQAALLSSQLDKLDIFAKRRKELVKQYDDAFASMPEIVVQKVIAKSDTVRHLYIIQLNTDKLKCGRKEVFDALQAEGVGVNVHYIPVYFFPYYQKLGYKIGSCPNAEYLYERIVSIPLFYSMTNEQQCGVIEAVKKVINYYRK